MSSRLLLAMPFLVGACGGSLSPDSGKQDAGTDVAEAGASPCTLGTPIGWITPTGCGCDRKCSGPPSDYVHSDFEGGIDCWVDDVAHFKVDPPTCTFRVP